MKLNEIKPKKITCTFLLLAAAFIFGCQSDEGAAHRTTSGHGEEQKVEEQKGPHGGKIFDKDGFAVEVTIYEPDIPPQSRVYVYRDGKPIDPSSVTLVTELHRIDRVDTILYSKQDDYLIGDKVVEEPHSFDVTLKASYDGKNYNWLYSSYEGRTTLSEAALKSTGIEIEKVTGANISTSVTLNGRVIPDSSKVSRLTARFPGVVKEIRKLAGSRVEKGDVLARIEGNESLQTYDLVSPRAGEVLQVSSAVGEGVTDSDPVITVGDLSTVWIELSVPKGDFSKLKVGQKVLINPSSNLETTDNILEGRITYLSALADGDSQTRLARAEVANSTYSLIPELFVEAKVVIEERQVPVAIKAEALQKFRDWDVVFRKVGQNFEIAILELGDVDGDWIEVREGLLPGTEYVTKNSFVVKADVMKSGASHDH